jgi:predicted DNA-binding transcriptional regulator YafY
MGGGIENDAFWGMDQFDRVFLLHRLLASRRATVVSVDDMLELLREHSPKSKGTHLSSLKRALRHLRDRFDAPLRHDRERGGYYYDTDGSYELPGLWFTADELSALLVLEDVLAQQPLGLLAEALNPARAKLEQLLQRSRIGMPQWRKRLRLLRMAARPAGSQFTAVASALAAHRRLRIDYHARHDDRMAPRVVSPQRLTLYRDNWYLDAWCHLRDDLRTFSLDRIIAAETLDEVAQAVPAEELDAVLSTSYGIFSGQPSATAELRFSSRTARWVAAEIWHPEQQDTHEPDGKLVRKLPYHQNEELLMDILRHGAEVEVLAPAGLRQDVVAHLTAALDRYAPAETVKNLSAVRKTARSGISI